MTSAMTHRRNVVAGLVHALCTCCSERQELATHPSLDATQLACPETGLTYLDRGDGLFEQDGRTVEGAAPAARAAEPEVLSDRPKRTADKARIILENATFA